MRAWGKRRTAPKARNMRAWGKRRTAPKARNMRAWGKHERSEVRRPWKRVKLSVSPERAQYGYCGPSGLSSRWWYLTRGDALRFASRLPLAFIFRAFGAGAPGFHIPRLWRWCPWLSYSAPLALCPWLSYSAPLALCPWLSFRAFGAGQNKHG